MNKFFRFFAGAAAFAASGAAFAADEYIIDGAHTQVMFEVDRFGFTNTIGTFAEVEGVIRLDEKKPAKSSVEAMIKVASVKSDNEEREGHVKGPYWLDAEKFPVMTFKSTEVVLEGEDAAKVTGLLNLHGVEAPVTLDVKLRKIGSDPVTNRKAAGFSVRGSLDRTAFGINTAAGLIGTEVTILIEALGVQAE